ncbi:MAG: hypothetical protein Q9220_003838 [cf. Caloplaca sp. 1 TL-2023]
MYCTICGGPVLEFSDVGLNADHPESWLGNVVLLHEEEVPAASPTQEPEPGEQQLPAHQEMNASTGSKISVLPAKLKRGPYFLLTSTDEEVIACDAPKLGKMRPKLYFPCHAQCFEILQMIADHHALGIDEALTKVHDVLKRQWSDYIGKNGTIRPVTNLMNARKYGDLWKGQELVWRSGEEMELYETDPLDIPNLMSSILEYAKGLFPVSPFNPAPHPYPHAIFQHPILPWIWDFNADLTEEQGKYWWTIVIEDVSELYFLEDGKGLPLGLRNQRRIWALVEDLLDASEESGGE